MYAKDLPQFKIAIALTILECSAERHLVCLPQRTSVEPNRVLVSV